MAALIQIIFRLLRSQIVSAWLLRIFAAEAPRARQTVILNVPMAAPSAQPTSVVPVELLPVLAKNAVR